MTSSSSVRRRTRVPAIVSALRDRVLAGEWKPKQQILTEYQLAREFGVSRGTVVRSLRQLEGEGLLWSRRGGGRYVSEITGGARVKTKTIAIAGLELGTLGHPVVSLQLAGMRSVCLANDYHIQLFAINPSGGGAEVGRILSQIDPSRVDGALISATVPEDRIVEVARRVPVVLRSASLDMPGVASISFDFCGGMFDLTTHLLDLGHRDIVLVTISETRRQGWQQREGARLAIRRRSDLRDSCRLRVASGASNLSTEWINEFDALMRLPASDRPTAVMFGSDELCVAGMKIIRSAKLRVPQDVSITSVNDSIAPPDVPVPLTCVRGDYQDEGRHAAQMLIDLIAEHDGGILKSHETFSIPMEMVVRESTAAPARK